ncbi:MAG TPA: DUF2066 domain-containing protein [Terriglobales bacterium]|nr:DUF2066 domain-containing protein [Terriglobales bacterium]
MCIYAPNETVESVGQLNVSRNVIRLTIVLCVFIVLWADRLIGQPGGLDDIYTTRAVVTGTDERDRPCGFRLCFEDVVVKVSGDASILSDRRFTALAAAAGQYVSTFSYRDLFEGKPVHDEQGTYDRPHFLTCQFDPQKIDGVLNMLGRKPWLGHRPRLVMILIVHGRTNSGLLSRDGDFDPDMREALANAAQRYALTVNLPSVADLQLNQINIATAEIATADRLLRVAELSDSELPLVGDLRWSDAALGWIASWSLAVNGQRQRWSVSGVNYDEAFRNAVRGAARMLSGNGEPM